MVGCGMKKQNCVMLLLLFMLLCYCSGSIPTLEAPVEQKNLNLIIGCLIFDVNGYRDVYSTIRENIEIAVVGNFIQQGEMKTIGFWATTDENGYFNMPNVPDGEYAIKGFRTQVIGLGDLIIVNELLDPQRNYFELKLQGVVPLTGRIFDTKSHQRIINFEFNIFTLNPNELVQFKKFERLVDLKLTTGEVLNQLPVPVHFFENYQESGWAKYLEMQIK
jgi:hypothetical protein